MDEKTIFTIGHSTKDIQEFINILKSFNITQLIDIRKIPRSIKTPQFNSDVLQNSLKDANIKYEHIVGLGGLRRALKDSMNIGWRNSSFRGYADHMQTKEFEDSLSKLIDLSNKEKVVLMCVESVPWRCHRLLIADALLIRGINAEHIFNKDNARKHELTTWANVDGTKITYPLPKLELVKE